MTPAQIALLRFFCDDLKGFFFAGDTAQTIAHGVGFRFETLKDIFHDEYIGNANKLITQKEIISVPDIFQLRQNFRTHANILKLANMVVKLLLIFFPSTLDKLEDEISTVSGPLPVFLMDTNDVVSELFSKGDMNYEFGAEQVILVGNNEVKKKVRSICGDSALVLTVMEAKGMEFQDVLIYNFFSCGNLDAHIWRVIGGAFEELGLSAEDVKKFPFPQFDPKKHGGLCVELKKLYVLLTRSKRHLFIFEVS